MLDSGLSNARRTMMMPPDAILARRWEFEIGKVFVMDPLIYIAPLATL
jgi:hypothetical protein